MERLDLYARLHMPRKEMIREVDRLAGRIPRTCLNYCEDYLEELRTLVHAPEIDYPAIVRRVEALLL